MKLRILAIYLLTCFLPLAVVAQTEFAKLAPQTSDFMRYGNLPVSLYSGQVNVSVPLYHIEDPDFDIPLALNYTSDGYKPAKRAGWTGLNCFLSGVGAVTREVYQIPDDFQTYATNEGEYTGMWQAVQERKDDPDSWYTFNSSTVETLTATKRVKKLPSGKFYDSDPDLFLFNMPGHSGRFMICSDGTIKCNDQGYKIDLSGMAEQNSVDEVKPSQIVITAPNGYVYTFGNLVNTAALEYSEIFLAEFELGVEQKRPIICAWHLTSITAPNGRKLLLNYEVPTDLHRADTPFKIASATKKVKTDESKEEKVNDESYSFMSTKITLLKSIDIEDTGVSVEFVSTQEQTRKFFIGFERNNNKIHQLDTVYVKQDDETLYSYALTYENKSHMRFLKKVSQPDGGNYTFTYTHPSSYTEPLCSEDSCDIYGYLLKGTTPISMMSEVKYPTGGYSSFNFEPHQFTRQVQNEATNVSYTTTLADSVGSGFGFRIKQISHYAASGNLSKAHTYSYLDPYTNKESGIILKGKPFTRESIGGNITIVRLNAFEWNKHYNLEEPHLAYSYVTETLNDGSYTRYYFSDYAFCPDETNDVAFSWVNTSIATPQAVAYSFARLAASKWDRRGLLMQKSIFDQAGREIRRHNYVYRHVGAILQEMPDEVAVNKNYTVSFRSLEGFSVAMKVYLENHPLIYEAVRTFDSDNTSTLLDEKYYDYEEHDLLSATRELTSNRDTLKHLYTYSASNPTYAAKHVLNHPLTVKQYLNSTLLSTRQETLKVLSNGDVVTEAVYESKDNNALELKEKYSHHDVYSHPTYVEMSNGINKVLVWSYCGRYPVAEILGATYDEVKTAFDGTTPESLSEQQLPVTYFLNKLDTALPHAHTTICLYKPLLGMEKMILPNGDTRTYHYDKAGRLLTVKDKDGYVLEQNEYRYQNGVAIPEYGVTGNSGSTGGESGGGSESGDGDSSTTLPSVGFTNVEQHIREVYGYYYSTATIECEEAMTVEFSFSATLDSGTYSCVIGNSYSTTGSNNTDEKITVELDAGTNEVELRLENDPNAELYLIISEVDGGEVGADSSLTVSSSKAEN